MMASNERSSINSSNPETFPHDSREHPRFSGDASSVTPSLEDSELQNLLSEDQNVFEIRPESYKTTKFFKTISLAIFIVGGILSLITLFALFLPLGAFTTQSSGFHSIFYSLFLQLNGLIGLLYISNTSVIQIFLNLFTGFFLFLVFILEVSGSELRRRDGQIGILLPLFTSLSFFQNTYAEAIVQQKLYQDRRQHVGYGRLRRYNKKRLAVLLLGVSTFILALTLSASAFLSTATRLHDSQLGTEGKKINVLEGRLKVHLNCYGQSLEGQPKILLEAGETTSEEFSKWVTQMQHHNKIGRICYWDRPGIGLSDNFPGFVTAGQNADILAEALQNNLEDTSNGLVLISHGMGGIYSRIFAARNYPKVSGIMQIDAIHEDQLSMAGSSGNIFRYLIRGIFSTLGLDYWPAALARKSSKEDRIIGPGASRRDTWIKNKLIESVAAATTTMTEIDQSNLLIPQGVPLMVVSSGKMIDRSSNWAENQHKLTRITANLKKFIVVPSADHNIWEDSDGHKILNELTIKLLEFGRDYQENRLSKPATFCECS